MAGLAGDITDIMGVIQRNKELRENRRQFDINAGLDARRIADSERRTEALTTQAEAQAEYARTGAEKQKREFSVADAREAHYRIQESGVLTDTNMVDTGSIWTGLESGNTAVTQSTIDLLNYGNDRLQLTPPGFKINGLTQTKDGYVIEGVYEDGRRGVLTQQGGTGDDETVLTLSKKDINHFLNLANSQMKDDGKLSQRELSLNANINLAQVVSEQGDLNETAVVGAVSSAETQAGGDRQASRALMSALSSAETEAERQGIILDFANENGIEIPYREAAEQAVAEAAPQGSGATRAQGRGRAGRSAAISEANKDTRRQELPGELAAAKADLAAMEEKMGKRGVDPNHPTLQQRRDKITRLEQEMEELGVAPQAQASAEPSVDFEALRTSVDQFVANLPPEEVSATAKSLEQQGVTSVADIPKLPDVGEQARAWALVATYAQDENSRNAAMQNIRNLGETGIASLSRKDYETLAVNRQNADSSSLQAASAWENRKTGDSYLSAAQTSEQLNGIRTRTKEGEWSITNPQDFMEYSTLIALTPPGGRVQKAVRDEFATQVNQAVVEAANNPDSIWGSFLQIFTRDAKVDPTAFDFNNVRVRLDADQNPVEFYYVNSDGNAGGQPIPAGQMLDAVGGSKEAFNAVAEMAKVNSGL